MASRTARLKRFCGVATLCLGTLCNLIGVAFVCLGFSTDNWTHISVSRGRIMEEIHIRNDSVLAELYETDPRYFDRVEGIFRECYPMVEKPKHDDMFLNPVQEWCTNINYYMDFMTYGLAPEKMTYEGQIWLHCIRGVVAGYTFYFMFAAIACVVGFVGCWSVSSKRIYSTSILLLIAGAFAIGGMACYHVAEHFELYRVLDEKLRFYQTWPEMLQENTLHTRGWSYIIAWMGIALTVMASIFYGVAASALKMSYLQESMPDYHQRLVVHANQMATIAANGTLRRQASASMASLNHFGHHGQIYNSYTNPSMMNYLSYPAVNYDYDSSPDEGKMGYLSKGGTIVKELTDAKL